MLRSQPNGLLPPSQIRKRRAWVDKLSYVQKAVPAVIGRCGEPQEWHCINKSALFDNGDDANRDPL